MTATWKMCAALAAALCAASVAQAEVRVAKVFGDHMVLQRNKPVPVFGTADAGEKVTVSFGGQTVSATADARGAWEARLPAMRENTNGQEMTVAGSNTVRFADVLVGDVWLCSGQSNMDMGLGGCNRKKEDVDTANFPGIRSSRGAGWTVCSPSTAGGFSAVGFYFARKIHQETKATVPIGLLVASVGGTKIDLWVAPEGLVDIPVLHPLLKQPEAPSGPFSLSNRLIAPLAPYGLKGAIWYQGENAEVTVQSKDSYYLKMKALAQGWKRLWGMDDFPFYFVMIANWGKKPENATPELSVGGWDADTRLQQVNAMALPHAGCASALDIGDSSMGERTWDGWHPKGKLDVGERLAQWALKNDYGRSDLVASGPVLKDAVVVDGAVECSFAHTGGGLMVGSKAWYQPTKEIAGGTLERFVIAGDDGKWYPATATIKGEKVVMSSPSVPRPRKISYACWQNPEGCNLYNKEGLPAAPFHIEDVTKRFTVSAAAGEGGEIVPAGTTPILQRMTALYTIKPKPGYFIQDVKVDGVSVGSVPYYTFDPVYANHKIEASFVRVAPSYTVTASANGGGAVTPSGAVAVAQGGAQAITIVPNPGLVTKSLTVDGVDIGARDRLSFCDVRTNHTVAVSFACPILAAAGFGGAISPCGDVMADHGGNQTFTIRPIPGYTIASVIVDGKDVGAVGSYTLNKVTSSHTVLVKFKGGAASEGKIPKTDQLIFACLSDALPGVGKPGAWPTLYPEGGKLAPISSPVTHQIDGKNFSRNLFVDGDGFSFKSYAQPIPCNGASIIAVARPVRGGGSSGWVSIVDVFYDRLVLGVRNDSGVICVRRNGPIDDSKTAIPEGQITILSLIVQPDGTYKVYANGAEVMASSKVSAMKTLVPGEAGFAKTITVGRNSPDGWTTFNGDIGDVFLYKAALTDEERKELETYIARKLVGR